MVLSLHGWNLFCSSSCKRATILVHFAVLFLGFFPNSVVAKLRVYRCSNITGYDSRFSDNLNRVMDDLVRNTYQTGFSTSSHGHAPYKVYGLLQCWGNLSPQECANCSQEANFTARFLCPNNIGALMWTDKCFLRYGSSDFFSNLDMRGVYIATAEEITTDLHSFKNALSTFMLYLSKKACVPANKGFALGSMNYSSTHKVYGGVLCLRDISIQDCRTCLSNAVENVEQCCSAKQGAQVMFRSCTIRYEIYPFFDISKFMPFSSTVTSNTTAESNRKTNLLLVLGVLGAVILVLAASLLVMRSEVRSTISRWLNILVRRREETHEPDSELGLPKERNLIYKLKTLREATENFHSKNKLGEGGFGPVYKGTIRNGNTIAVKRLSAISRQGKREFMNEVKLVANLQHRNLVKLLGCCAEGAERLLVYEYLQNKSLDTFIFEPKMRGQLDWQKVYSIIIGIARGILYLHEDSQLRIIHRDIKANNILLDENLNPKIADFGLARLFLDSENYVRTRVAGTYGYMAPEYAMRGQLSLKADVYSFGVLLLEILSGRRNTDIIFPWEMESLLEWAWRLYKSGNPLDIVDSTLRESCSEEQAIRCIHVGLLCVQSDATLRPHISGVITMMSNDTLTLPNPTRVVFVGVGQMHGSILTRPSSISEAHVCELEREANPGTSGRTSMTTGSSALSDNPIPVSMVPSIDASVS